MDSEIRLSDVAYDTPPNLDDDLFRPMTTSCKTVLVIVTTLYSM